MKYSTYNSHAWPAHLGLMQFCFYQLGTKQGNKQDLIKLIDQEISDLNFVNRKPF